MYARSPLSWSMPRQYGSDTAIGGAHLSLAAETDLYVKNTVEGFLNMDRHYPALVEGTNIDLSEIRRNIFANEHYRRCQFGHNAE